MGIEIENFLNPGAESPKTSGELSQLSGYSKREIAAKVYRARRNGLPICASNTPGKQGYFLASTEEELKHYCKRLKDREKELRQTRRACEKIISRLPLEKGTQNE